MRCATESQPNALQRHGLPNFDDQRYLGATEPGDSRAEEQPAPLADLKCVPRADDSDQVYYHFRDLALRLR